MSTATGKAGEVPISAPGKKRWTPGVAFCCNWCSYAGSDLPEFTGWIPSNVKVIRMPCSSRINPLYARAFSGADGVLVAGCHPETATIPAAASMSAEPVLFRRLLEFSGIEPERFQVSWISASEGDKFAGVMQSLTEKIKALGPNGKWRDSRWQSVE